MLRGALSTLFPTWDLLHIHNRATKQWHTANSLPTLQSPTKAFPPATSRRVGHEKKMPFPTGRQATTLTYMRLYTASMPPCFPFGPH